LSAAAKASADAGSDFREATRKLIERGLRAQLAVQSLITGQLMVTLDFHPDIPARFSGLAAGGLPELPTIPSSREKLTRTLDGLHLDEIATDLRKTVQGIERLVNADDTKETVAGLKESAQKLSQVLAKVDKGVDPLIENSNELVREVRGLVKRIDERVEPIGTRLQATMDAATRALSDVSGLLSSLTSLEMRHAGLPLEIRNALRSMSGAMDALKGLGSYLQEHPEALLKGKPGN
jgi:paraquat-inducible protein B